MGPSHDDRTPQEEPTREPLVDLNVKPAQPGEPSAGSTLRRKRLSDMQPEGDEARPQPPTARPHRRSLAGNPGGSEEQASESESCSEPRRPRLVNITAAPEGAAAKGAEPEGVTPEEQEPRPKVGRPRVTITQSFEDTAGLQNIIDPPHLPSSTASPAPREEAAAAQPQVDPTKVEQLVAELRAKQNFSVALVGGLAAAVLGAMVWALITVATNYQIGWMAVGVGFLVGGAVRTLGHGIDKSFGHLGATMSVFGCLLGNVLSICAIVAAQKGLALLAVVTYVGSHPNVIPSALIATFHPMDLLFYGLAIYEGYRFSFRRVTDAEIGRVMTRN